MSRPLLEVAVFMDSRHEAWKLAINDALMVPGDKNGAAREPGALELPVGWGLKRALKTLDIERVPFQSTPAHEKLEGYTKRRTIAVNPRSPHPFSVVLHESVHVVLAHAEGTASLWEVNPALAEFEAETAALLTMAELNVLDSNTASRSRGYIQSRIGDQVPTRESIDRVMYAVGTLVMAGYAQEHKR